MNVLWLSAALMLITALAHSTLSEMHLMPLVQAPKLTRTIVRYALHAMSVFMLLSATTVVWPGVEPGLVGVIGLGWLLVGVAGLVVTGGKHRGWPVIVGAGICAMAGAWL